MSDNNDELKSKIETLEQKVKDLEKKLEDNSKKDKERAKKHHEEMKTMTEKNHGENMTWNKIQAFSVPVVATIVVPILITYLKNRPSTKTIQPIKEDADDMKDTMKEILKTLKDKKQD